ncbi:hypothetical protein [Actinoallomurus iriomotensis]|uniref:Transcriptional regulator n=1 Tax=Actinoallomurus iriomotensis TaxID=478107 RepID=A0A9W6VY00_9ACTN|nr:hypothetical protein [Actinoallomurus iriomotensis]GLY83799.1 hypothetical protein Airi02_017280 [Actinoallomurus iriomotensis]
MRIARTCYDHLAGRSAVALLGALLERKALVRDDGRGDTAPVDGDPSAGPARVVAYRLTEKGDAALGELGVVVGEGRRPLVKYCVDWTERRHHLSGRLGAALLARFRELDWVRPGDGRSLVLTPAGRSGLHDLTGRDLD